MIFELGFVRYCKNALIMKAGMNLNLNTGMLY